MYEYVDLAGVRSIRLLELLSYSKSWTKLTIRLKEVDLDDFPVFDALSNAWEGQAANEGIICDGNELLISSTCKAALRRLRHNVQSRFLWIDQICINQSSERERIQQVTLMADVYSRAKRVIVWLGVSPESVRLLRNVRLYYLFGLCQLVIPGLGKFWFQLRMSKRLEYRMKYKGDSNINLPALHPVTWFDRMWTVQEVALARQVRIVTTTQEMNYDTFMSNLDDWLMSRNFWSDNGERTSVGAFSKSDPVTELLNARTSIRNEIRLNRDERLRKKFDRKWTNGDPIRGAAARVASRFRLLLQGPHRLLQRGHVVKRNPGGSPSDKLSLPHNWSRRLCPKRQDICGAGPDEGARCGLA